MLGDTPTTIVNRALQLIGDNMPAVSGTLPNFDPSPAGVAAAAIYTPTVQTIARTYGYDFSRNTTRLLPSGNVAPQNWLFEYLYPTNGIEIRQLMPANPDKKNPLPQRWQVAYVLVNAVNTKVIWSDTAGAVGIITGQPPEALWDALFTKAVEQLLASQLAEAIPARPNTAAAHLESARAFEQVGESRNG